MLGYRIAHKKYTDAFFAPGFPGRWNGAGRAVLYCSESLSLAFMESMIRRQGVGFHNDFQTLIFDIPENLPVKTVLPNDLPDGWRRFRDYAACQKIGNTWFDEGLFPILKVPSAVIISSFNIVLNTWHADFKQIKLLAKTALVPDERIENILKRPDILNRPNFGHKLSTIRH